MRPKVFRIRFLPVNDCAIMAPLGRAGGGPARDDLSSICVRPRDQTGRSNSRLVRRTQSRPEPMAPGPPLRAGRRESQRLGANAKARLVVNGARRITVSGLR